VRHRVAVAATGFYAKLSHMDGRRSGLKMFRRQGTASNDQYVRTTQEKATLVDGYVAPACLTALGGRWDTPGMGTQRSAGTTSVSEEAVQPPPSHDRASGGRTAAEAAGTARHMLPRQAYGVSRQPTSATILAARARSCSA